MGLHDDEGLPRTIGAFVLIAAAVCPGAPLLVPELAPGESRDLEQLRSACGRVLDKLTAVRPDAITVVGVAETAAAFSGEAVGSLASYGVPLGLRMTGAPTTGGRATLPLSLTIGAWLLGTTGWRGTVSGVSVSERGTGPECVRIGWDIAARPGRTAVLVVADGSARRSQKAPGYLDDRALAFDDGVAAALAAGDDAALRGIDSALAGDLLAAGRAPLQVLGGAAEGASWRAELLGHDAPYGVAYFVAAWWRR